MCLYCKRIWKITLKKWEIQQKSFFHNGKYKKNSLFNSNSLILLENFSIEKEYNFGRLIKLHKLSELHIFTFKNDEGLSTKFWKLIVSISDICSYLIESSNLETPTFFLNNDILKRLGYFTQYQPTNEPITTQ